VGIYASRRAVHALPLNRAREPFSSPDWIYELKYDGFRALAEIEMAAAA